MKRSRRKWISKERNARQKKDIFRKKMQREEMETGRDIGNKIGENERERYREERWRGQGSEE